MKSYFYFYQEVYIKSSIPFPELIPVEKVSSYDVTVKYGEIDRVYDSREIDLSDFTKATISSTGINISWNDISLFNISNGNEIILNPQNGLEKNLLRLFILGYGLAILLYQRGNLILHANAVDMGDGALVLLGSRGAGKSTTSLALHKKGYNLLADDVLNIKVDGGNIPLVSSGFQRLKLWPDVIRNIQEDPESIPRIHSKAEKRSYSITNNFFMQSKPIKSFYVIEKSDQTKIDPMKSHYSLIELIKSSYCFKLFDECDLSDNLNQCAKIVKKVPMKNLKIKQSFQDIPQLVKIIEKDYFEVTNHY